MNEKIRNEMVLGIVMHAIDPSCQRQAGLCEFIQSYIVETPWGGGGNTS